MRLFTDDRTPLQKARDRYDFAKVLAWSVLVIVGLFVAQVIQ